MIRLALSSIFVLFALSAAALGQKTADEYITLGNEQFTLKNYDGAIKAYTECIRLDPTWDGCYHNRGLAYYNAKNYDAAIADATQVIKLKPQRADAYVRRGLAHTKKENYQAAISDYEAALKIEPNDPAVQKALDALKNLISSQKKLDDARKEYKAAEEKQNTTAQGFYDAGNQQFTQKNYDAAILSYTSCINANPLFLECFNRRGIAYSIKKDHDKAITDFTTILILKQDAAVFRRRALVYRDKEDYDSAIKDFTKAIELMPSDPENFMERGATHVFKGAATAAIPDLTQAIKLDPKQAKFYFVRGYAYQTAGNNAPAISDYKKTLEIDPAFAPAKEQLQKLGVQ